jgi:hypothetical protein
MKKILLIVSLAVFAFAGYYFISSLRYSTDMNYIIYMCTWLILIMISFIGIVYNFPPLRQHRHVRNLIYNSYSANRIRNKEFDRNYHIFN